MENLFNGENKLLADTVNKVNINDQRRSFKNVSIVINSEARCIQVQHFLVLKGVFVKRKGVIDKIHYTPLLLGLHNFKEISAQTLNKNKFCSYRRSVTIIIKNNNLSNDIERLKGCNFCKKLII